MDAYVKLLRASDSVLSALLPGLSQAGLTLPQFGCLEALFHLGPLCPREIGRKLLRSPGNVTTVLDNLEKGGLVRRVRDNEDRRYVTVHLTGKGRILIEEVFPRHAIQVDLLFSVLTARETEELARICRKLGLAASTGEPASPDRPNPRKRRNP